MNRLDIFAHRIRRDREASLAFGRFLSLRMKREKLDSPSALRSSAEVKRLCASRAIGSEASLRRSLYRAVSGKSGTNRANLFRFATVLGYRDAASMLDDFERSTGSAPVARFEPNLNGHYILQDGARLIDDSGTAYRILERLNVTQRAGDSYKAVVETPDGLGEFAFVKVLSLDASQSEADINARIKLFHELMRAESVSSTLR